MQDEWIEPRMPTRPRAAIPPGACDTHAHVFDYSGRFPFVVAPSYPPPKASFERHEAMLDVVGLTRGVVVQTAAYGTDPSLVMRACALAGGRLRAVAAADCTVTDQQLAEMASNGVRGLRFCEIPDHRGGGRFRGSVGFDTLEKLAPRMREHGLHAVLWAPSDILVEALPRLLTLGVPIVLDHMGSVEPARRVQDPLFRAFLALLREGRLWIKLVACRVSKASPDYPDLSPFHEALIAANTDQLLWGSDWPYVNMGESAPDVGHLLDLFVNWAGDGNIVNRILVDNPARLFGFDRADPSGRRA